MMSAGLMLSTAIQAQTAPEQEEMEVIEVTARHTKERAKDIPFSISVVDQDALKNKLMFNVEDALRNAAGVDIYTSGGAVDANIRIRGVGSLTQVNKSDGSVVVNIDGVSMPAGNVSLGTLDVNRIEILKGPQGTLFGLNSEAGAVNIVTNKPTDEAEVQLRAELGQDDQHLVEAVVNGGLTETLNGRIAVRKTGEDHWITNSTNNQPLTEPESTSLRLSLLWEGSDKTSALVTAESQKHEGFLNLQLLQPFTDKPASQHTSGVFDNNEKTIERLSAEINHEFANSQFTSISAVVNTDFDYLTGLDSKTAGAIFNFPVEYLRGDKQEQRTLSQELRLTSLPNADTFWVAGITLHDSERDFDSRDLVTLSTQDRKNESDSQAVYGEFVVPMTDAIKLTLGARYTWESKNYNALYTSFVRDGSVMTAEDSQKVDDNYATGRLALTYAYSNSTNLYAVAARGYKSGGFNDFATSGTDSTPYRPAKVDSFELGFKQEGQQLALNGSVFFNSVTDDHLLGFDFATFASSAVNADTDTFGAELEGNWFVTEDFVLAAAISYLDTEIKNDVAGVSGGPVTAGSEVPDVPKFSANLSANHYQSLPNMLGLSSPILHTSINYRYLDERPADAQNHFNLDSYGKLDARIALQTYDMEFYLWADNLTDEEYDLYGYINAIFAPTAKIGAPAKGRRIGLGASFRF